MTDDFLEIKKLVIAELIKQISDRDKRDLAKEFGLSDERLHDLIVKLADKWLNNADYVVMLASIFGVSAPRKTKDKSSRYIG